MSKINWKQVGSTIINGGGVIVGVALCTVPYLKTIRDVAESVRYYRGCVSYSDAVSAVLSSDMFSSAKEEAVKMIPKDGDNELYRSIIQVVNSDAFSGNKVNMIKDICGKEDEA